MSSQVNRRNFVNTIIGSTVALSIAPQAFAQYSPIPSRILLCYNENPYRPSAKGLQTGAEAAAGVNYPATIKSDLRTAIAARNCGPKFLPGRRFFEPGHDLAIDIA